MNLITPHFQVKSAICRLIKERNLKPGTRIPTIKSLADDLDTSIATVHRAISSLVGEGVLATRRGSGTYVASMQDSPRIQTVSMVTPLFGSELNFTGMIVNGAENIINNMGYRMVCLNSGDGTQENEEKALMHAIDLNPCGILASLCSPATASVWNKLAHQNCPVVCINNLARGKGINNVTLDNALGGGLAASHLLELGHRDVVFASLDQDFSSVNDREEGFLRETKSAGANVHKIQLKLLPEGVDPKDLRSQIGTIMKTSPRPTAIFAINDSVAVECMKALKEMGLSVPEDVSVIGFDDNPVCQHVSPLLTTIRQPAYRMGQRAAEILMSAVEDGFEGSQETVEVMLKPEIVIRQSTQRFQ